MRYLAKIELSIFIGFCLLLIRFSPLAALEGIPDEDPPFIVKFQGQYLTVRGRQIPLERILSEIAQQSRVRVVLHGSAESRLSADFSDVPLEEGLRRLSRDMNRVFIFASRETKRDEVEMREMIIYPEGPETDMKAVEPPILAGEKWVLEDQEEAFLVSLVGALEDKDPLVREGAVDFLSEYRDGRVTECLSNVLLEDRDEDVRASAARALGNLGDEKAIDALLRALQDEEVWVRENVLRALGQIGGERVISGLEEVLADEDKGTRDLAAHLLKEIRAYH